jgi:23S rRNA pseudouridine1911/1915/1917 synthase
MRMVHSGEMNVRAASSVVERCPDKTEVEGSIPSPPTRPLISPLLPSVRQRSKVRFLRRPLYILFMTEPTTIYEDRDIVAINKPSGLLVHLSAASSKHEPTLVDWLLKRYPEIKNVGDDPVTRPGIVHRLDKATSGIMLIARNQDIFLFLKSLFASRQIQKTYHALVYGELAKRSGTIEQPIGLLSGSTKHSVHGQKMIKEARTDYKVLEVLQDGAGNIFSYAEVSPKTGRTHQIRVHFAAIGHSLVGDPLYGRRHDPEWATRLMLHAFSLEFKLRDGNRIKLEAEEPEDFKEILKLLYPSHN